MTSVLGRLLYYECAVPLVRYRHFLVGKPPGVARSLEQRLAELNYKDPTLHFKVNIGFKPPVPPKASSVRKELAALRCSKELEHLARTQKLEIPLEAVEETWKTTGAPFHIKTIAEHYGVFQDLFGDAYFYPVKPLDIDYKSGDLYHPVYRGNVIKPSEASKPPEVQYKSDPNTLWTLILTNPDGHFTEENAEYILWFIGNIPGCNLNKGDVIWDYLQPFPAFGTGYQRCIFILFKQDQKIDYSSMKKDIPCLQLSKRTFKTEDFYRQHQKDITPAGLAFFQTDWDPSLTDFYHNVLQMKEPRYEYDFPEPYIAPQEWFPRRKPFNIYQDKYRDQKAIAKEYLLKKFKNRHPFEKPPTPLRFPNAHPIDHKIPSWLKEEMKKDRLGWGRINDY
ncbi:hypothetical protein R5R35_002251 [Gryllus longicercus]|uniref:Large ribosomal subunit protein mL38 n=1 Tax=Gryllus longicercus TaxID=2509291 RepID=A0AAN9Z4G5_9ORTH